MPFRLATSPTAAAPQPDESASPDASRCHARTDPGVERPRAQERDLLLRYHRGGDLHARELLLRRFLPLARNLARRYQLAGEPIDDLVQVASIDLLKAIDRFDPERGTTLTTFAVPTILGRAQAAFPRPRLGSSGPRGGLEARQAAGAYRAVPLEVRTAELPTRRRPSISGSKTPGTGAPKTPPRSSSSSAASTIVTGRSCACASRMS
jgi:hypothetical protein